MTLDLTLDEVLKSLASFSPSSDIKASAARMMWIAAVRKACSNKVHFSNPRVAENVGYFSPTDADCAKLLADLDVDTSKFPPILAFQRALALAVELRLALAEATGWNASDVSLVKELAVRGVATVLMRTAFDFPSSEAVFGAPLDEIRRLHTLIIGDDKSE